MARKLNMKRERPDGAAPSVQEGRKMKVIEELWYENLKMCEREVPKDSPLRKSLSQATESQEKLAETLNEEQRKMLEALIDDHMTLTADLECDAFTRDVRIGARMMMEILTADDGQNL